MIVSNQLYLKFYTSTEESWQAMLTACEHATESIDVEQFIFNHDTIGKKFIELFVTKARQGVKVRLLFDMVGSLSFYLSGIDYYLRENGIEIAFFNPVSLWRVNLTSHFFRDHRKLLIVDGKTSFIGGVGVEDRMKMWRDNVVEIRGDVSANVLHVFDLMWKRVTKGHYRRFKRPPVFHKHYEISINSPRFRQRFLYHTYVSHVRNAQHRIYLASPYFVPDRRFFRALRVAAHRGVDVRLIIPKTSDVPFIDYVQGWYIGRALEAGVRVFTYDDNFYHVKMGLIDEAWATVGSFNLDNLSFMWNHEANIISSDDDFTIEIRKQFETDFGVSKEITYRQWQKRSFVRKCIERLTYPFHRLF